MQSLHLDLAKQELDQEKRIVAGDIRLFRHTNRPDSLTELFGLHKESIRSNLQSLHRCMPAKAIRTFDALHTPSWLSISRPSLTLLTSLAHLLNLLQPNHIDIEPMWSQCEMRNRKYLWDISDATEWITARAVNVSHSNLASTATTRAKNTCSTVYLLASSRYQLPYRCFISWKCIFRTSQSFKCSVARLTNRSYVIFETNESSDFDSLVSAIFASVYDLTLESTASRKLVRKLQAIHRWGSSKDYLVEVICSNDSHSFQ